MPDGERPKRDLSRFERYRPRPLERIAKEMADIRPIEGDSSAMPDGEMPKRDLSRFERYRPRPLERIAKEMAEIRPIEGDSSEIAAGIGGGITGTTSLLGTIGGGALTGLFTGNPLGIVAGAIAAGIGSGVLTEKAKEFAATTDTDIGEAARFVRRSERDYPLARIAGEFLAQGPLAFRSLRTSKSLVDAASLIGKDAGKTALRTEIKRAGVAAGAGGVLSAGLQGGLGVLSGKGFVESIDPIVVTGDILFGGLTTRPGLGQAEVLDNTLERLALAREGIRAGSVEAIELANRTANEIRQAGGPKIRFVDETTEAGLNVRVPQIEDAQKSRIVKNRFSRWFTDVSQEAKSSLKETWTMEIDRLTAAGQIDEAAAQKQRLDQTINKFVLAAGGGSAVREFAGGWKRQIFGDEWARSIPASVIETVNRSLPEGKQIIPPMNTATKREFGLFSAAQTIIEATPRKRQSVLREAAGKAAKLADKLTRKRGIEERINKVFDERVGLLGRGAATLDRLADSIAKRGDQNLSTAEQAMLTKTIRELMTSVRMELEEITLKKVPGNAKGRMNARQKQMLDSERKATFREMSKPIKSARDLNDWIARYKTLESGRMQAGIDALNRKRVKAIESARAGIDRRIVKMLKKADAQRLESPMSFEDAERVVAKFNSDPVKGPLFRERQALKQEARRELLDGAREDGLLSAESLEILKNAEAYELRLFSQHLDSSGSFTTTGGRVVTVNDSGIKRLKQGSTQALVMDSEQLFDLMVEKLTQRRFRNRAELGLLDMAKNSPDPEFLRLARRDEIPTARTPIKDLEGGKLLLSAMVDGKAKYMVADKRWAEHWVQSDPMIDHELGNVLQWITGTKVLKLMATGINPAFALANLPRDFMQAWLTTNAWTDGAITRRLPMLGLIQQIGDYAEIAKDVIFKGGGKLWDEYVAAGGSMTFRAQLGREKLDIPGMVPELQALADGMGWIGETSEKWTRLAVFKRKMKNSKHLVDSGEMTARQARDDAAKAARDFMDFGQGGSFSKALDNLIPYLNASIQGTRSLFKGAEEQGFGQITYKLATVMSMSGGLYMANVMLNKKAYDEVPEHDKLNNFIFTLPENMATVDSSGNKRYPYLMIAKDQSQRAFSALMEALLARQMEGKVPTETWMNVLHGVQQAIPILGEFNVVPPVFEAMLGSASNFDFWRRQEIWRGPDVLPKDEHGRFTSPLSIDAGRALGVSPAKLDYAARTMWTSNLWTNLAAGAWGATMSELPKDVADEVGNFAVHAIKHKIGGRFWRETRPDLGPDITGMQKRLEKGLNSARKEVEKLAKSGDGKAARLAVEVWNRKAMLQIGPKLKEFEARGEEVGQSFISRFTFQKADISRMLRKIRVDQTFRERQLGQKGERQATTPELRRVAREFRVPLGSMRRPRREQDVDVIGVQ